LSVGELTSVAAARWRALSLADLDVDRASATGQKEKWERWPEDGWKNVMPKSRKNHLIRRSLRFRQCGLDQDLKQRPRKILRIVAIAGRGLGTNIFLRGFERCRKQLLSTAFRDRGEIHSIVISEVVHELFVPLLVLGSLNENVDAPSGVSIVT
jgi:hypothetical protein